METFRRDYVVDEERPQRIRFLCRGEDYELWGVKAMSFHLFCPPESGTMFLLGTDRLGRDALSRILYGARISLTIGLVGIAVSFALGLFFGGLAGYLGGWVDHVVQRMIEILRSLPELPLWLALSAALPPNWSPILVFFGITIILGMLDWPGLARAVRSKLLALREEDFVRAAELMGASKTRIIARHLIPNFMSHLIASATLSIPSMILGETALSFLGLGLRPPVTSWGVLLNEAQNPCRRAASPLAAVSDRARCGGRPRLQLHGRRPTRRRRPLPLGIGGALQPGWQAPAFEGSIRRTTRAVEPGQVSVAPAP